MIKNIGIILPHLGPSQISFMVINHINSVLSHTCDFDFTLFFSQQAHPCVKPNCATMNITEIWGFSGLLIASSLEDAASSLKVVGDIKRLYYIQDLEWLTKQNYEYNLSIMQDPKLTLICRSKEHSEAIQRYCGRKPTLILPNFNIRNIINEFCR